MNQPLENSPEAVGCGLVINETWNFTLILEMTLALMLILGMIVGLYSALGHDSSTAVGLGAYLVAMVMLVVTLLYWQWQEREI